jgi:hypothetical protein
MHPVKHVSLLLQQFGELESGSMMTPQGVLLAVLDPIVIIKINHMHMESLATTENNRHM